MTNYLLYIFLLFGFQPTTASPYLDQLREEYASAAKDADLCKKNIDLLMKVKNPTTLQLAYSGAFHAIWADHLSSPLAKLNAFKKGKEQLEKALQKDKDNIEVRFLRLTIQFNSPAMLGYKNNIEQDLALILENLEQVESVVLKNSIRNFLLQTDLLSVEQRKMIASEK